MTGPSEAAKAKACELTNVINETYDAKPSEVRSFGHPALTAFATFIQQVSDAAKEVTVRAESCAVRLEPLTPFILPDPVDTKMTGVGFDYKGGGFAYLRIGGRQYSKDEILRALKIVKDET